MSVAYPAIPIPLVTGYSHPDSQKTRFNNFNTGPPDFVLLSEHGPSFPKVNWLFKDADFATFEAFYKDDLVFGAISFDMNLSVGAGLKLHECYFSRPYKPSLQGKLWKVTADLVTVEKQYDTLADFTSAEEELAQQLSMVECGEPLAVCGEPFAECGNFKE